MSRVSFLTTFLICAIVYGAAGSDDISLRNAWLQAPKSQGANWTRVALLGQLMAGVKLDGVPRTKVVGLFGQPGYSAESYPERSKIEVYRLSAANDRSFRVDYDSGNRVTGYFVDNSPCSCDTCTAGVPVLSAAVLDKSGLMRTAPRQGRLTMSAFERMLGQRGQVQLSHNRVGGQMWLNYTETWRVGSASHQFLMVWGHTPARDAPTDAIGDKFVESWALVSFMPECLAK
jgi:hypothetical protein